MTGDSTLYASPFTCSLAVHLVLRQHAVPFELVWVQRGPGRRVITPGFEVINPLRKVPALRLPDGEILVEMVGILAYLEEVHGIERTPVERRRLLAWLSTIATELHKQVLAPLFDPETPEAGRRDGVDRLLGPVLARLEAVLVDEPTVLGGPVFTSVDAYVLWGLLLLRNQHPERVNTPILTGYLERHLALGFVREALGIERAALRDRQLQQLER